MRHRTSILVGATAGLLLGVWAGSTSSQGTFYVLATYFAAALVGLVSVGLLVVAALVRRSGPVITAAAFMGGSLFGLLIGPDAPGSVQGAPGEGSVGTRADSQAVWSGPVTCHWHKDESTAVDYVEGFYVPITDAAFLVGEGLHDGAVTAVSLDSSLGFSELIGSYTWIPVRLEGVSRDGRSGTAVLNASGGLVFAWTCSGGP